MKWPWRRREPIPERRDVGNAPDLDQMARMAEAVTSRLSPNVQDMAFAGVVVVTIWRRGNEGTLEVLASPDVDLEVARPHIVRAFGGRP